MLPRRRHGRASRLAVLFLLFECGVPLARLARAPHALLLLLVGGGGAARRAASHRAPAAALRHALVSQAVPEAVLTPHLPVHAAPLAVHPLEQGHAAPPHLAEI